MNEQDICIDSLRGNAFRILRELWDAGVLEPYCDDMIENLAPWRDDYRQRFQEIKEKFSA